VAAGYDLDAAIRKIPDFPRPGILFYDITGILTTPAAFRYCVDQILERHRASGLGAVAAIEARGFVFAAPAAYALELPLILVRKKGKLPGRTFSARFTLEYGEDEIEIHREDVISGSKVLLVDDLIATGGTLKAACSVLEQGGATVAGIFGIVGLPFLNYDRVLDGYPVQTLIQYHGE
jgi:adenine phosphoribosyltransferase